MQSNGTDLELDTLTNPDAYNHIVPLNGVPSTTACNTLPEDVMQGDDGTSSAVSPNSKDRVRISKKNAVHGMVEGAMRGAKDFEIVRMKRLRPIIANKKDASARFLRSATEIIDRCERLSNETGCWLYFTAQHMFATEPFFHYTSSRLLKEGKKDIEQITNHFNRLFLTLIAARNEDTKEMHKKLLSAQENEKATKEALVASENAERAAVQQSEDRAQQLEEQRLELELLKLKLRRAERLNGLGSSV
ncbi:hypothetical protein DFH07DRAFT_949542 [Mycena maculata]|uniref:Uncharacterized protein n=1 Tax=Mycena maculata TaxID=230809 RepID=A0AAD7KAP1_9AGAR|nr:hypothetical protein DFH07DRAFT_949542 [Mycena maculata]